MSESAPVHRSSQNPYQVGTVAAVGDPVDDPQFSQARGRTLVAVMFCYLFYYTGRQTFGFAIPGMMKELGLDKIQLGWCGAAMLWCYAIGQAINGQLADRFGGKRMMALGACFSFLMNVVLSFAHSLPTILIPWAINGLAQSMGWAPGSRILSNWFDREHRGRAFGWYLFAAGCSSVLTFGLAAAVLPFGWRWIFRLPVCLLLLGSIVFWLVAKERPSEIGHADLPEETDGDGDATSAESELTVWQRYRKGLASMPFLFGCFSIGFQNLARYGLLVWVPVHLLGENWDKSSTKWVAMALPFGMALGAMTAGWMSDRVFNGRRSSAIILFLMIAAVLAGVTSQVPRESILSMPLLFLLGFFVYGPQSGYWALCPDLLGRRFAGTGTGIMNFFAYLFAGLGEPLIGGLIQHSGSTSIIFTVVATACAAGSLLMLLVRR